jgi:hypothetical protein
MCSNVRIARRRRCCQSAGFSLGAPFEAIASLFDLPKSRRTAEDSELTQSLRLSHSDRPSSILSGLDDRRSHMRLQSEETLAIQRVKKEPPPAISPSVPLRDDSAPSYSKSCPGKRNCDKNYREYHRRTRETALNFASLPRTLSTTDGQGGTKIPHY